MASDLEKDLVNRIEALHTTWGRGLRQRREEKIMDDLMMRHRPEKDLFEVVSDTDNTLKEPRKRERMVFQRRDAPVWSLYSCVICMDPHRDCPDHEFQLYHDVVGIDGYVSHVLAEGRFDEPSAARYNEPRRRRRNTSLHLTQ